MNEDGSKAPACLFVRYLAMELKERFVLMLLFLKAFLPRALEHEME